MNKYFSRYISIHLDIKCNLVSSSLIGSFSSDDAVCLHAELQSPHCISPYEDNESCASNSAVEVENSSFISNKIGIVLFLFTNSFSSVLLS